MKAGQLLVYQLSTINYHGVAQLEKLPFFALTIFASVVTAYRGPAKRDGRSLEVLPKPLAVRIANAKRCPTLTYLVKKLSGR